MNDVNHLQPITQIPMTGLIIQSHPFSSDTVLMARNQGLNLKTTPGHMRDLIVAKVCLMWMRCQLMSSRNHRTCGWTNHGQTNSQRTRGQRKSMRRHEIRYATLHNGGKIKQKLGHRNKGCWDNLYIHSRIRSTKEQNRESIIFKKLIKLHFS